MSQNFFVEQRRYSQLSLWLCSRKWSTACLWSFSKLCLLTPFRALNRIPPKQLAKTASMNGHSQMTHGQLHHWNPTSAWAHKLHPWRALHIYCQLCRLESLLSQAIASIAMGSRLKLSPHFPLQGLLQSRGNHCTTTWDLLEFFFPNG